jgi:hypothetical protein
MEFIKIDKGVGGRSIDEIFISIKQKEELICHKGIDTSHERTKYNNKILFLKWEVKPLYGKRSLIVAHSDFAYELIGNYHAGDDKKIEEIIVESYDSFKNYLKDAIEAESIRNFYPVESLSDHYRAELLQELIAILVSVKQ